MIELLVQQTGLVPGHAYTILGGKTDDGGEPVVILRNPWGRVERLRTATSTNNGIFEYRIADFLQNFSRMVVALPSAPP